MAQRFLRYDTSEFWMLNAAELQLGSVDRAARPLVADLGLDSSTLNRILEHFVSWTGRPLMDRRYLWMIEC